MREKALDLAGDSFVSFDGAGESIAVGQWYWIKDTFWDGGVQKPCEWFGCVMFVGSNYAMLESPRSVRGNSSIRVHFNDIAETLRGEEYPKKIIAEKIGHYQCEIKNTMSEIQAVTARLGFDSQRNLANRSGDTKNALAVLSGNDDINNYESALVKAKDVELPGLFKKVKKFNESLAKWLSAESLPLLALSRGVESSIDIIKDRIFNVSLYAGLIEDVKKCTDGEPAKMSEKLRVMQRRLYMDEECLLGYRLGGMDIKRIDEFDEWLVEPENLDRILPFPRCMVAMRVRRNEKARDWGGSLQRALINFYLAQDDKLTFLYIRNGGNVYRLECELEFDEMIFPGKSDFDPSEPLMVKNFGCSIDQMITLNEYDSLVKEQEELKKKAKQWERENPKKEWLKTKTVHSDNYEWSNPYRDCSRFSPSEWRPFDPSNVYYDDCVEEISTRVKKYNRIALIIQGLFDRSEVLHPHPPVQTWTPEGFSRSVELIYDGSRVLHHGDAPDFEAYRSECNAQIDADSVVIGQDRFWALREGVKESARIDNSYRDHSDYRPEFHRPYGNPGPGYIAKMSHWQPRARKAVFAWYRERQTSNYLTGARHGDPLQTTLTVPIGELFNVSAYKSGDYLQFFRDPRARAEYLQWAPMLLAAEEYHAGNLEPREPIL